MDSFILFLDINLSCYPSVAFLKSVSIYCLTVYSDNKTTDAPTTQLFMHIDFYRCKDVNKTGA